MKWQPVYDRKGILQPYSRISDCGKFKVAKYQVRDKWIYMLWQWNGKEFVSVGDTYSSMEEAEGFANESIKRGGTAEQGKPIQPSIL